MQKRTVHLIALAAAVLVIGTVLAYTAFASRSDLDGFVKQRLALLKQLDSNVMNLPSGFEHVLPPNETSSHPPAGHIESVVKNGELWYADNFSSYDLRIVAPLNDASPRDILDKLFPHLATGLEELGFTSPKSGGPDWIVANGRAAHSTYWRDSDRNFIITISVVIDAESDSVHVTRYVHERFE